MNRSIKSMLGVLLVAVLACGMLASAPDVWAQAQGSTWAKQLQGTWMLVSIYNEQDGKKSEPLGSKPRGCMILTSDGHWSMILMQASLPKFASNNRMKSTAEENEAIVHGSVAYFGTYAVLSEKEHTMNLHMEASTFPNWDGQDQKRVMTISGDELKVINPHATMGGTNYVVWKRAK